ILTEMKTNRIGEGQGEQAPVPRVEKGIVRPLGDIEAIEFPTTRDKVGAFRKALDNGDLDLTARLEAARKAGAQAQDEMRQLILALNAVMLNMQSVGDLNKIIGDLRKIEEEEQRQQVLIDAMRKRLIDIILGGEEPPKKPEDKKEDKKP